MLSPRTANYVAAMIREGDDFDYYKWLKRVREEEAQASHVPTAFASGELVAAGMGIPINTSRPYPSITPRQALPPKTAPLPRALCQLRHEASRETPKARLRRRLEKIRDAWDDFQATRARDAVYGYLDAVFAIVYHYRTRRRTKKLLRHAFKFANLPFDKNADPFTAVIRCTCNGQADNKTISKWARALRYAGLRRAPAERQGPRPRRTPAPRFVCQARFLAGRGRADWSNRDSLAGSGA
jgi:hypothetical protein